MDSINTDDKSMKEFVETLERVQVMQEQVRMEEEQVHHLEELLLALLQSPAPTPSWPVGASPERAPSSAEEEQLRQSGQALRQRRIILAGQLEGLVRELLQQQQLAAQRTTVAEKRRRNLQHLKRNVQQLTESTEGVATAARNLMRACSELHAGSLTLLGEAVRGAAQAQLCLQHKDAAAIRAAPSGLQRAMRQTLQRRVQCSDRELQVALLQHQQQLVFEEAEVLSKLNKQEADNEAQDLAPPPSEAVGRVEAAVASATAALQLLLTATQDRT